jgi:2-polyprenyl-3-methyl-5-hydroxy-6-metoxy-1,4-benzoquinol methylase
MILETISVCPICSGESFNSVLVTRDYTVSQKEFTLQECESCKFLLTNPRPDQASIGQFYQSEKYISHTGGSRSLIDQVYLQARKITLRSKFKLITRYKKPGTLLDYGCGTGEFLQHMQNHHWVVDGVEPSENARHKAHQLTKLEINNELGLISKKFDVITLWHVLEHVHNLNEKVLELKSHLDQDGIIFIAVPNYESADSKKYGPYWAGYDVPRHLWHFTATSMTSLLSKHGLQVISIEPMKLDSYYVSLLSEGYQHPKRLGLIKIMSALISGIQSNRSATKSRQYSSLIYIVKQA